jgi:hypothetical protein
MTGRTVNDSMAGAVATDLLPRAALQRALPRLKAMNWLAGVFTFAGAGYAIEALGTTAIFLASALVALAAAGALVTLPASAGPEAAAPAVLPAAPKPAAAAR